MFRLSAALFMGFLSTAALGAADCQGEPTQTPMPEPTPTLGEPTVTPTLPDGAEDLVMQAEDFKCITSGAKVNKYYIWNDLGHLDEALAVAQSPSGGIFPVGTVVQLVPAEAMVKRHRGWNAETGDWEFFFLDIDEDGTSIIERGSDSDIGATGVENGVGGNCHSCHAGAEPQWDFICDDNHGCDPLPFSETQIQIVQNADPRCP